ncbi:MAG TPA: papain-like cysteine protease family protein [Candidatus Baltobacteraceae bacterium]|jgi:hypothetical protein
MIAPQTQEQTNWCWIACYLMVCSEYGVAVDEQCIVAQRALGVADCCTDGSIPACNKTLDENQVTAVFATGAFIAANMGSDEPSFRTALNSGQVLVMLSLPASYHYILVADYNAATQIYTIHDPQYATSTAACFTDIQTAYGQPGGSIARAWAIRSTAARTPTA